MSRQCHRKDSGLHMVGYGEVPSRVDSRAARVAAIADGDSTVGRADTQGEAEQHSLGDTALYRRTPLLAVEVEPRTDSHLDVEMDLSTATEGSQ
jgi:hypothetical protein